MRRAVDRFLRDQLMTVRRHHGDRIEWERAQGIWPGLVRSLDFSKRYAFSLVSRVETILSQEGEDGADTAVTFNIDLTEMRRERLTQMGLRAAMAFALLGLGGAAMVPGFGVYDIVALAGGSVAAGGIFALERRRYLESRSRVALAPERFLDLLAVRQQRRSSADPDADTEDYDAQRALRQRAGLRTTASPGRLRRRDCAASARPVVAAGSLFLLGSAGAAAPSPARRGTSGRCWRRRSAGARCSRAAATRRRAPSGPALPASLASWTSTGTTPRSLSSLF